MVGTLLRLSGGAASEALVRAAPMKAAMEAARAPQRAAVLTPALLREGLVDQIARERGRRESNDVASALIEQMKVQLKLLVSFQQMMGMYLTAQIMINGPLYLVGRQVAVCIARQVLDLGIFVYFLCNFSECHVNAFPYVALPRAQTDSGTLMGREMLEQPEVWT